ncbi:uncharacterized protein N7518_007151 [Penicillium psychrosexuale]|uniref:uncharacterized protein n=1 Tax=Penicillium psychrosexuale TaxID=1002107 RepID=UPI0025455EB0|nr:uncharacterized protein N7518_007151 [Penicillium psychrosexuale]KAJ5790140.1 hypothetical protein N7518_007151 [Penicillium psychrosexuale]
MDFGRRIVPFDPIIAQGQSDSRYGYNGQELDRTSVVPHPTLESLLIRSGSQAAHMGIWIRTKGF